MEPRTIQQFIDRWEPSGGAERGNYQSFLNELCDILEVPRPDPATPNEDDNAYVYDKAITFHIGDGSTAPRFIDLYKRGCFVCEAKQGVEKQSPHDALSQTVQQRQQRRKAGTATRGTASWDAAMISARGQAEQYARALPATEGRPPFLVIVDIGHSIELYAEFTQTGGTYIPFPDPTTHRLRLQDLTDERHRETLRRVWTDPLALDPASRSARVTRDIAERLARLAVSLEASGHAPEVVSTFLMRCLFTMFAEDVRLLPSNSFTDLLQRMRGKPELFVRSVESLWETMRTGGASLVIAEESVLRFNGGLFEDATVLPLTDDQLELLIEAGKADWRDVEPAIFGTLLERALDPRERRKLGAHYTPRAYVERLVVPTIVEPLREEWSAVQTAALTLARQGKESAAIQEVEQFHKRLCAVRVLDPACGSGNFLYVTLEHLKRLEGEVLNMLDSLGERQILLDLSSVTVSPQQLLGLEVNARAANIAELVLWIGYLQWHFRTRGSVMPPEPVIGDFRNIECRDAVLAWDDTEPVLDDHGKPVTRWDGRTTKNHPVTGEDVPDETAQEPVLRYINPRKATWPEADFVVGNPPYLGARRIRLALGNEYLEALREVYSEVPEHCDYVMCWWHKAAELVRQSGCKRFGFITTNSISQAFSRKLLQYHLGQKESFSIRFAIPDHPWVDSSNGAAVRVAMTVCDGTGRDGMLKSVLKEMPANQGEFTVSTEDSVGNILANLTIGADILSVKELEANSGISCVGYQLSGKGFVLTLPDTKSLSYGRAPGAEPVIKPLVTGKDIAQIARGNFAIDLFGFEIEEVQSKFPEIYQWIYDRVKPERDQNNRESVRRNWWLYGECRSTFRPALSSLNHLISTPLTAKFRYFVLLDANTVCDSTCVMFALDDAYYSGILSSAIHVIWSLRAGGRLGVGNDPRYLKSQCFDTFPFPAPSGSQKSLIRGFAESLDTHRKRQQEQHPSLTMTDMYNVLEKLRSGEPLTKKEQTTHEQGLVSVLQQIHDDLDAAVFDAYGWPTSLSDEEILERLVALNAERAAEEQRGIIRWLRPEFQNPAGTGQAQTAFEENASVSTKAKKTTKAKWPKSLPEQAQAVRSTLISLASPATPEDVARSFSRAKGERVGELLETLVTLGQALQIADGRFVAQ